MLGLAAAGLEAAAAQRPGLRSPRGGEVRALVVGINAYRHVKPLKGAVADARDLEATLRRSGAADITTLIDEAASREAILSAAERLVELARPDDLIVLALAGHGAQEPERVAGSESDGMDEVFLLSGFDPSAAGSLQRVFDDELNHLIKRLDGRGARVLYIADTCHGGGLTREVDPRAAELSYRQVPRYAVAQDDLKPISTASDAFLTEIDFPNTLFLAAVDKKSKAPEVIIPEDRQFRGALSYAVSRAFEGAADADRDARVTAGELFAYARQVAYQLTDQRQNIVTMNAPDLSLEADLAFELRDAEPPSPAPASAPRVQAKADAPPAELPVRIAALDGQPSRLEGLEKRESPFEVVGLGESPDLVWDPVTGDVLAGADVVARGIPKAELPGVIDRASTVKRLKQLGALAPQAVRIGPDDRLHRRGRRVEISVDDVAGRALILLNMAGDGTVQMLYPQEHEPAVMTAARHVIPVEVGEPFGADQVVAITHERRMGELEQALRQLDRRRASGQIPQLIRRFAPEGARIGSAALFTAP